MPKISEEKVRAREDEILNACRELYATVSFKDITIKDIGKKTSFTRTSIYNYFRTKEEIFLCLIKREYERWVEELTLSAGEKALTAEDMALLLALTLSHRELLLKVLSMNMYDIECNSRFEKLIEFKTAFGASKRCVALLLINKLGYSEDEAEDFIYAFFPFVLGVYPYSHATEKQIKAMRAAKVEYKEISVYDMVYTCAKMLLK